MSSRVTETDRKIAERMKAFRNANPDALMSKLAEFLGIKYQSYQALEKGSVSFRYSTVEKLAAFYGVTVEEFLGDEMPGPLPSIGNTQYILGLLKGMSPQASRSVLAYAMQISREDQNVVEP